VATAGGVSKVNTVFLVDTHKPWERDTNATYKLAQHAALYHLIECVQERRAADNNSFFTAPAASGAKLKMNWRDGKVTGTTWIQAYPSMSTNSLGRIDTAYRDYNHMVHNLEEGPQQTELLDIYLETHQGAGPSLQYIDGLVHRFMNEAWPHFLEIVREIIKRSYFATTYQLVRHSDVQTCFTAGEAVDVEPWQAAGKAALLQLINVNAPGALDLELQCSCFISVGVELQDATREEDGTVKLGDKRLHLLSEPANKFCSKIDKLCMATCSVYPAWGNSQTDNGPAGLYCKSGPKHVAARLSRITRNESPSYCRLFGTAAGKPVGLKIYESVLRRSFPPHHNLFTNQGRNESMLLDILGNPDVNIEQLLGMLQSHFTKTRMDFYECFLGMREVGLRIEVTGQLVFNGGREEAEDFDNKIEGLLTDLYSRCLELDFSTILGYTQLNDYPLLVSTASGCCLDVARHYVCSSITKYGHVPLSMLLMAEALMGLACFMVQVIPCKAPFGATMIRNAPALINMSKWVGFPFPPLELLCGMAGAAAVRGRESRLGLDFVNTGDNVPLRRAFTAAYKARLRRLRGVDMRSQRRLLFSGLQVILPEIAPRSLPLAWAMIQGALLIQKISVMFPHSHIAMDVEKVKVGNSSRTVGIKVLRIVCRKGGRNSKVVYEADNIKGASLAFLSSNAFLTGLLEFSNSCKKKERKNSSMVGRKMKMSEVASRTVSESAKLVKKLEENVRVHHYPPVGFFAEAIVKVLGRQVVTRRSGGAATEERAHNIGSEALKYMIFQCMNQIQSTVAVDLCAQNKNSYIREVREEAVSEETLEGYNRILGILENSYGSIPGELMALDETETVEEATRNGISALEALLATWLEVRVGIKESFGSSLHFQISILYSSTKCLREVRYVCFGLNAAECR
jgi:hypothetical protein